MICLFLEFYYLEDFLFVDFYSLALFKPVFEGCEAIDLLSLLIVAVFNYLLLMRALVTYCRRA